MKRETKFDCLTAADTYGCMGAFRGPGQWKVSKMEKRKTQK